MDHGDPTATGCRIQEFARWPRLLLERERAYLSEKMASADAFMGDKLRDGIMHDLTDLDYLLAQQPPEHNPSPGDLS